MSNERSNGYAAGRESLMWAVERVKELEAENERLKSVLEAFKEIRWHLADDNNE